MSVTGGTIAHPFNMLDEVLALNNIHHTSGSVNFPFHEEEPYNTTGVRKKDFEYAGGKNGQNLRTKDVCVRKET